MPSICWSCRFGSLILISDWPSMHKLADKMALFSSKVCTPILCSETFSWLIRMFLSYTSSWSLSSSLTSTSKPLSISQPRFYAVSLTYIVWSTSSSFSLTVPLTPKNWISMGTWSTFWTKAVGFYLNSVGLSMMYFADRLKSTSKVTCFCSSTEK